MITPKPEDTNASNAEKKLPRKRRYIRAIGRATLYITLFWILYAAAVWGLGRLPVNRDFQHATTDAIPLCVVENGVHADLILPLDAGEPALRSLFPASAFPKDSNAYHYAIVGWGNRKFYLETATWNDLRVSNVLYALSGLGETTVHVSLCSTIDMPPASSLKILVTPEQFARLMDHIRDSLKLDPDGIAIPIPDAHYGMADAFFEGKGSYHLFRTCNVWVGTALRKAGVRVGIWTVTPKSLFASLPEDARLEPQMDTDSHR